MEHLQIELEAQIYGSVMSAQRHAQLAAVFPLNKKKKKIYNKIVIIDPSEKQRVEFLL